ncbi:hypothetical protein [Clostridium sp.]|uniref:hypothetical protein n=1 Tax=Clostridium sp. TaxID=1506 RepID=UPI002FCC02E3
MKKLIILMLVIKWLVPKSVSFNNNIYTIIEHGTIQQELYNSVQTSTEKVIKEVSKVFNNYQNTEEEEKRVKLYIAVMRDAFKMQNGGNRFIAIKKDSLVGLDEKSKEKVLDGFKDLSPNLYWFEDVKDNKSFFILDKHGLLGKTIKGTFLYINLIEFKDNEAVIEATSWYGNLGGVIPMYKAVYKNGQWELRNIGTGIA